MRERMSGVDAAWLHMDRPANTADVVAIMTFEDACRPPRSAGSSRRSSSSTRGSGSASSPTARLGLATWDEDRASRSARHLVAPPPAGAAGRARSSASRAPSRPSRSRPTGRSGACTSWTGSARGARSSRSSTTASRTASRSWPCCCRWRTRCARPAGRSPAPDAAGRGADRSAAGGAPGPCVSRPPARRAAAAGDLASAVEPAERARARRARSRLRPLPRADDAPARGRADPPLPPALGPPAHRLLEAAAAAAPARARRALGVTVNDVLVTALAGSLRHVLLAGRPAARRAARARAGEPARTASRESGDTGFGNRFGLVFLRLPVGTADPARGWRASGTRMRELKRSPDAVVTYAVLGALGHLPSAVDRLVTGFFSRKASLVVTNVPGPRTRLHLAGHEIDRIMFNVAPPRDARPRGLDPELRGRGADRGAGRRRGAPGPRRAGPRVRARESRRSRTRGRDPR